MYNINKDGAYTRRFTRVCVLQQRTAEGPQQETVYQPLGGGGLGGSW